MGKAEVGSAKYIANKIKAKGLSKLKFYCQICEKQCRDENGFKCHIESPSHLRRVQEIDPARRRGIIETYSKQFQDDFVRLLRMSHGEKPIGANRFYQEYIGNRDHIHLNSTRWKALSQFVKHLGSSGICRVEENEEEGDGEKFVISFIDKTAVRTMENTKKSDEEVSAQRLQEQIERAKRSAPEKVEEVSKKLGEHQEPIKINMTKTIMKCGMRIKPEFKVTKPVKKVNVLKKS